MRKDIAQFNKNLADIPYERKSIDRILWGYKDLDYYTKGIEVGLTIVEADTNVGKSILTMQVLQNVTRQGYKGCVFAGEHPCESYKMLVMQQNGKKGEFQLVPFVDNLGNETNIADWYVNEETEKKVNNSLAVNIELFDTSMKERDINTILDWIEYCNKEKGCRFCLIDNFMEIDNDANDIYRGQTALLTKLRNKMFELKMMGILIMHINKEAIANGFRLNANSASGTKNAGNKAYNLIALYRKDCIFVAKGQERVLDKFKEDCAKAGFDFDKCDSFIEVIKTKGNGNGIVGLIYNADTKTYSQAPKISKTEADNIFKKIIRQSTIEDLIPLEDDGYLPF